MKPIIHAFIVASIYLAGFESAAAVRKIESPFVFAKDLISKCEDFCDVKVADSPAPGQRSTIYANDVIRSLDAAGFSVGKKRLPRSFRVLRTSRSVSAEQMTDAARKAIIDVLPDGVVLDEMGKVTAGQTPTGPWEARALYDESIGAARTRNVTVVFLEEGVPFRKAFILCRMSYMVDVPVASRDIQRNEIILPDAIEMKRVKMDTSHRNAILSAEDIIGKRSLGTINQGNFFENRHMTEVPVVFRGDAITVVSKINGIRISARGIARQDAVRGKRIAVEIPSVGKVLFAEVIAAGLGVVTR
ncbi:MAG: flagellar basal body P-ring formation protein FlgA [Deltaproteobacteria bacterium]|nr:flagellar basal body P-ring formation protein FlgA [Deltaproteobacteria bacterium]